MSSRRLQLKRLGNPCILLIVGRYSSLAGTWPAPDEGLWLPTRRRARPAGDRRIRSACRGSSRRQVQPKRQSSAAASQSRRSGLIARCLGARQPSDAPQTARTATNRLFPCRGQSAKRRLSRSWLRPPLRETDSTSRRGAATHPDARVRISRARQPAPRRAEPPFHMR